MAKVVRVLNSPSVEPQEVPGMPDVYPIALSDSGWTEQQYRDAIKEGAPLEIVDERGGKKAASQAQEKAGADEPAANSEDRPAEVAGPTADQSAAGEES